MPTLFIPCVRKFKWDSSGGTTVEAGFMPGEDGGGSITILIKPSGSPVDIAIVPFPPFVIPVPDFEVIFGDLFGKSRIQIQKDEIQKYLTQIFRFAFNNFGYPLHDDHALQFKSSGVRREFLRRPELAILADAMWTDADAIVTGSFGYDKSGPGIRERFVNQFLANASYNEWPVQATLDLWHAMVRASTCPTPGKPTEPPSPPPPLPPPPLPPPAPQRDCPPGMPMDVCLETCGKIRQLSASQLPLPPDLAAILDYFRDCILPPDGSWQYQAPIIQDAWGTTFTQRYAFLPKDAVVTSVPQWAWPYNWPANTQVDEIKVAGTGGRWPVGTVLVIEPGIGDYVITPDGQVQCSVPPPVGSPDPPDVDDPIPPEEPPDPTPRLNDLQQQIWTINQDLQQFKQVVFLQFDSIKKALWDSMTRGNFQAAEVYARAQGGWQGDPPAAQQPPLPPGWQTLPTPGAPQVLEIPPIQPFPQAPAPQPVDLTGLQQQLLDLQEQERQINAQIEQLQAQIPIDISNGINWYDQNVEKPDIQKIRDECCTPTGPLTEEQRQRICEEGRLKWGIMAECWLNANTPAVDPASIQFPADLVGQSFATELKNGLAPMPTGHFATAILGFADKIKSGLFSGVMPPPEPLSEAATGDLSYIYEKAPEA